MRLFLIGLAFISLPALAGRAYKDDLYHERFLFGEKSVGRFVMSIYSQRMDTVRFGDCLHTTRCAWLARDFHRDELKQLHNGLVDALEKEFAERSQKRGNIFTAFLSTEDDTAELGLIIAELKEDGLENWILNRQGNPFAHNFRSNSLYTKIVKVMKTELEKPLPSRPVYEADSSGQFP